MSKLKIEHEGAELTSTLLHEDCPGCKANTRLFYKASKPRIRAQCVDCWLDLGDAPSEAVIKAGRALGSVTVECPHCQSRLINRWGDTEWLLTDLPEDGKLKCDKCEGGSLVPDPQYSYAKCARNRVMAAASPFEQLLAIRSRVLGEDENRLLNIQLRLHKDFSGCVDVQTEWCGGENTDAIRKRVFDFYGVEDLLKKLAAESAKVGK